MTVRFVSRFFASTFRFWFDFCTTFPGCPQWVIILQNQNPELFKMCVFDWQAKTIAVRAPFCVACKNAVLQPPLENFHISQTMCDKLFVRFSNMGDEPSDCYSSCPCYYSQIEGLGLHFVNIARYGIRIKKHLQNRIEIIEIESLAIIEIELNRKE